MVMSRVLKGIVVLLTVSLVLTGCGTSKAVQGGAIGAAAGGVVGAVIGKQAGNTAVGAIIGAAIGGTAGAMIGNYMDKQAKEMEKDLEGAKIERVGEGIKVTFDSGLLFAVNSATLSDDAKTNITRLSKILNKYPDTNVLVEGHTDATGSEEHNLELSERRARSVTTYATAMGVTGTRFNPVGYGEAQPIADNSTVDGRKLNRRVEIAIFANDKLKDAAEKGLVK